MLRSTVRPSDVVAISEPVNLGNIDWIPGFHSVTPNYATHAFTMPAMSPTMTEGNIAGWRIKEGDPFSAGDVLLEVETDKASMDVEASDDGIIAKILEPSGSKGLKIGTKIAILAESEDDLLSLAVPTEGSKPESVFQEKKDGLGTSLGLTQMETGSSSSGTSEASLKARKQPYPLYPSVLQLLHERALSTSEADNIPSSGPKGRLLKGDVLAYVGSINTSYPAEEAKRIANLSHLDLKHLSIVPLNRSEQARHAEKEALPPQQENPAEMHPELATTVSIAISLQAAQEARDRVKKALGMDISMETLISRAIEISNENLPLDAKDNPTSDELFYDIMGLSQRRSRLIQGHFEPEITIAPSVLRRASSRTSKPIDIIDVLTRKATVSRQPKTPSPDIFEATDKRNLFSVTTSKSEGKKARTFLERMKTILQVDPGRLVL